MFAGQQQILAAVAGGSVVLTANKRLARHLRTAYDNRMQAAGKSVWTTPQIYSYPVWLNLCLTELGEDWRLLAPHQALRLWEQLIEDSCRGSELELLQVGKTAEKAYEAFQALTEHGASLHGRFLTDDQRIFQRWFELFTAQLETRNWLDQSQLPARICQALQAGELGLPQELLLVGFDQLPPGAEQLQVTCESLGGKCEAVELRTDRSPRVHIEAAQDAEHEIELAARWARLLLDQGATSVGVVVPDLQVRRRSLERIFRDQLDPAATPGLQDEEARFGLSLGGPLAEQGIIHAAIALLTCGPQLTLDEAAYLLRTPYLTGSQREADSRALLDRRIRAFRQQQISLHRLTSLADQSESLASFAAICGQLKQFLNNTKSELPGAWAERFATELQQLGWPGERAPASSEYQAVKFWREKLLPRLASLDPVSAPLSRGQALSLLRRLAKEIDFQLETPPSPLQVVGLLESGGLQFDHLWVMGLSETTLPAAPRPNPFIPYDLQEQQGMPHASAARELAFAEQVIKRLQQGSPEIVFSYPLRDGDCELRPSPLLPAANWQDALPLAEPQDVLRLQRLQLPEFELLNDDRGPTLPGGQGRGGTGILKDQAHCPFRAFAHNRLRARELDRASPGLDAMTRGDLVHQLLERLWTLLRDQRALLQLSAEEQQSLLVELAERTVEDYFAHGNRPSEPLLQLEQERLVSLLDDWLNSVERPRDPFQAVELETEHQEQLGPLQINTKIDRIDALENGQRVVLDYKTGGGLKADDLLTEPLLEPQLPIYAVAEQGAEADGVVIAQVRRGECRLLGVVREKGLLGRIKQLADFPLAAERGLEDWSELIDDWRRQLEKLATEFVAGEAQVRPFDLQRSCQYCDLPGFCRIGEAASTGEVEQ